MTEVDFAAHYTVKGRGGVAWRLLGFATATSEESWEKVCTDPAHVYEYDPEGCTDPGEASDTHDADCYLYSPPEEVEDPDYVRAVMVGDDREEVIDVTDLVLLAEDGFCRSCGQTGCTCNVYE